MAIPGNPHEFFDAMRRATYRDLNVGIKDSHELGYGHLLCPKDLNRVEKVLLIGNRHADLPAKLTKKVKLGSELVEFWVPDEVRLLQAAPNLEIHLGEVPDRYQCGPQVFKGRRERGSHDYYFVPVPPRLVCKRITTLAPRNVDGNCDAGEAADSLSPGRSIERLGVGPTAPFIEQPPSHKHTKPSAQRADDKQISTGDRFLHGSCHSPDVVDRSLGRIPAERGAA